MTTSAIIIQDVYETTMDSKATLVKKINLRETLLCEEKSPLKLAKLLLESP